MQIINIQSDPKPRLTCTADGGFHGVHLKCQEKFKNRDEREVFLSKHSLNTLIEPIVL